MLDSHSTVAAIVFSLSWIYFLTQPLTVEQLLKLDKVHCVLCHWDLKIALIPAKPCFGEYNIIFLI